MRIWEVLRSQWWWSTVSLSWAFHRKFQRQLLTFSIPIFNLPDTCPRNSVSFWVPTARLCLNIFCLRLLFLGPEHHLWPWSFVHLSLIWANHWIHTPSPSTHTERERGSSLGNYPPHIEEGQSCDIHSCHFLDNEVINNLLKRSFQKPGRIEQNYLLKPRETRNLELCST
jgi:hypothetical protein